MRIRVAIFVVVPDDPVGAAGAGADAVPDARHVEPRDRRELSRRVRRLLLVSVADDLHQERRADAGAARRPRSTSSRTSASRTPRSGRSRQCCGRAKKHKFRFEFTPIRYEQPNGVLRRNIVFNGILYNVALPVATELKWNAYRFTYEWDMVYRDRGFFGMLLETKYTDVQATLSNILDTEFARARAPIPSIGAIGRVYVVPNISITGELSGFKLPGQHQRGLRRQVHRLRPLWQRELHRQLRRAGRLPFLRRVLQGGRGRRHAQGQGDVLRRGRPLLIVSPTLSPTPPGTGRRGSSDRPRTAGTRRWS